MIIVTGAAGFIGSCLVQKLNEEGYTDLILVDDFIKVEKEANLLNKKYTQKIEFRISDTGIGMDEVYLKKIC